MVLVLKTIQFYRVHPYPDDMKLDRFVALISYERNEELEEILSSINFLPDNQQTWGAQYQLYNENHSAGWVNINEITCFLDVNKIRKKITIDVSGTKEDPFTLNEDTFQKALTIELYLSSKNLNFINPSEGDNYCITPQFYPELWNAK